jgi:hypothetical protein
MRRTFVAITAVPRFAVASTIITIVVGCSTCQAAVHGCSLSVAHKASSVGVVRARGAPALAAF